MNTQTCPKCGAPDLPLTARICPSCGRVVIGTAPDSQLEETIVAELVPDGQEEKHRRHRSVIQSGILGGIYALLALLGIGNSLLTMLFPPAQVLPSGGDPQTAAAVQSGSQVARAAGSPLVLVLYLLMLAGAAAMITRQQRGLAMTAAVIAMLPCSPGFLVGLPVGIWALVFLTRPIAREEFSRLKADARR